MLFIGKINFLEKTESFLRLRLRRHLLQFPDHHHHNDLREDKRKAVRHRLRQLEPCHAEDAGQEQDRRDEEQSLLADGGQRRPEAVTDGLRQHVSYDHIGLEWKQAALHFQRPRPDPDHLRILFSEQTQNRCGDGKHDDAHHQQKDQRHTAAKIVGCQHSVIPLRPEVETAHRLESLSETDQGGIDEHHDPRHNGHGRHRRVPETGCGHIQKDRSHTRQPLPPERRQASGKDLPIDPALKSKVPRQRL